VAASAPASSKGRYSIRNKLDLILANAFRVRRLIAGVLLATSGCDRPAQNVLGVQSNATGENDAPPSISLGTDLGAIRGGPVAASIESEIKELRPNGSFNVSVRVRIDPGWHIYAVDKPAGIASRTSLQIQVPEGIERAGEWVIPEASLNTALPGDVSFTYDGLVAFQCPLRVAADAAPGEKTIRCLLEYQACARFSCRPLTEAVLVTTVRVMK
jgi:DsbC/DsbD-like thiol-disulfide interchange protein